MRPLLPKISGKFPLQTVIVAPFLIQITIVVGIVGWLSYRNGQQAVNDVASELRSAISSRIEQKLEDYLTNPHQINQINSGSMELGMLDAQNLKETGRIFWQQMQAFKVDKINFANEQGNFIGVKQLKDGTFAINEALGNTPNLNVYETDSQGNRSRLMKRIAEFNDVKTEAWYADAVKAGRPVWSQIYHLPDRPELLSVSSSYPIYDRNKKLKGVVAVNLILSELNEFLYQLNISRLGQAFIVERSGFLVASSAQQPSLLLTNGKATRIKASESSDSLMRATAQYLQHHFGQLNQISQSQFLDFKIQGQRQFIHVKPWQDQFGLDWLIVVVIPEGDFMGQIEANTRLTVLLCLAALGIAIAFGLKTSQWIVKPILNLNFAAKKLAEGDWNQKLPTKRADEIGQLAQSFNRMTEQLKEFFETLEQKVKDRTAELAEANKGLEQRNQLIRQVFGRYLSNEIVSTLLENPEGLKLGGERRKITILTSDLRGFTARSEGLHPEEVVEILNFYLHHMADIITKYKGTIDEFMGDGILVLFGAPIPREDDAERAIACAIEMQLAMGSINQQIQAWGLPPLEMGIGINTGEVVVGNIGSEKRTKYGVVGNQVNLTYRIESYTVGGQILISETTLKEVDSSIKITDQKQVTPKGIQQPISIYEVGGIGGKYNRYLQKEAEIFVPLSEPIPIQYRILDGKHIDDTLYQGSLIQLSAKGAELLCAQAVWETLTPFTNIKLQLLNFSKTAGISEDIYAKILKKSGKKGSFLIYFTSLPSSVKASFEERYNNLN